MSLASKLSAVIAAIGADIKSLITGLAGKFDKTGGELSGSVTVAHASSALAEFKYPGETYARVGIGYEAGVAKLYFGGGSTTTGRVTLSMAGGGVMTLGSGWLRSTSNPTTADDFTRRGYIDGLFSNVPSSIQLNTADLSAARGIFFRYTAQAYNRVSMTLGLDGNFAIRIGGGAATYDWALAYESAAVARITGALRNNSDPSHNDDYTRKAWVESLVTNSSSGISLTYENRAALRTNTPANGTRAWVRGLGSFVYDTAATDLDDDETAFRTSGGCWLITVPDLDLLMAYKTAELDELRGDLRVSVADQFAARFIAATFTQSTSLVGASARLTINWTVAGALPGAYVIVSPPTGMTADLSFYGYVSSSDTITVVISNLRTTTTAVPTGQWPVLIINMNP